MRLPRKIVRPLFCPNAGRGGVITVVVATAGGESRFPVELQQPHSAGPMQVVGLHEVSFVAAMLDMVRRDAQRRGFRSVTGIRLRVGPLSCLCPESVQFAFSSLKAGDEILRDCRLEIARVPAKFVCRDCHARFALERARFVCPDCGGKNVGVTEETGAAVEWYEAEGEGNEGEDKSSPSGRTAGGEPAAG